MGMDEWADCLLRLRQGDYSAWPKHEWIRTGRFDTHNEYETTPNFGLPVWKGEEGGTVLVNADCGMGDTICFYRWLPQIKANIVLRCDEDFHSFFKPLVKVISKDDPIPEEVDSVIHMMAVPEVLGISEVTGDQYLAPHGNDFLKPLRYTKFTKIGLCWAGNPFNPRDKERSIPVEKFNLWDEFRPFGLVKHEACPPFIMDIRHYMQDWLMTAKVLSIMELVVSVDTAIAHLAGGMGIKTFLLLPEKTDWRWGDHGHTTPWYNSMTVFRKQTSWDDLLQVVSKEITKQFA